MQLLLPGVRTFLDVDDLQDISLLEEYVESSQCILIFLSKVPPPHGTPPDPTGPHGTPWDPMGPHPYLPLKDIYLFELPLIASNCLTFLSGLLLLAKLRARAHGDA